MRRDCLHLAPGESIETIRRLSAPGANTTPAAVTVGHMTRGLAVVILSLFVTVGVGGCVSTEAQEQRVARAEQAKADREAERAAADQANRDLESAVAEAASAGNGSLLNACLAGITWTCDVDAVRVYTGGTALQVDYRTFDAQTREPDDVARAWFTFMKTGGTLPALTRVDVVSAAGDRGSHAEY